MLLGESLKLLRKNSKLTQQELAQRAGISRSMISELEKGGANPSLNTLLGLSLAFNIQLSKIILLAELLENTQINHTVINQIMSSTHTSEN